ncbi:hypothetical protein HYDPIDRAFT_32324 [Hydnomerulius pinastri MD-312]|uniref:Nitrogen regulatory protein areA GATA-like domain-containing protein n=1 Tax=Hydnomerulius pinastri MD-312 TaxID=994086 RepID=A0A0C9W2T7_9AGAM|nr:hypothetical protein HYDPIDRAFT_32324 [Hydnomerulius pinastri MD-312]
MLATFPAPVLSVTADAVRDLQGHDALSSLWTLFTKCKESLQDGRRLENISWRLWYRELVQAQNAYRPLTPDSVTPHPNDSRYRSSFFSPTDSEKAAAHQALSLGLPSPADHPSPSPMPTFAPHTQERTRISPHSSGSATSLSTSFGRGRSSPFVGRIIVDMLPNNVIISEKRPSPSSPSTARSTALRPPSLPQAPTPSILQVPSVQLPSTPASTEASFPRVVVVNPTPHPTPPTTPILHDDIPGAPQPPSTFLLPPLPPPALRSAASRPQLQSQQPPQPLPKEPSPPPPPVRGADGMSARQSRFFLQQSPEDASPERGDGSTASGKSPSDLFEASSAASSHMKSATDVDEKDDEQEHERRSTTGHAAGKLKKGKEVGRARPMARRTHSARHVAPSMTRKPSAQEGKRGAMFNIGSGSSNGSRSANGSTVGGSTRPPVLNGFTSIAPAKPAPAPPQAHPPVIPNGLGNAHAVTNNVAPKGNLNGNSNGNAPTTNGQSRKKIVVASTSSEEYETTDAEDAEDSEEWASEEMDAESKAKEAEESRLREAALEAQRQRDLFAKVPKRSYSNLNRTQSGLLSQLMNPNPAIFPPNHQYRSTRSSHDIAHMGRQQQQQQQQVQVPQRSSSGIAPSRLTTSKSAAALPMAAQVTAISSSKPPAPSAKQHDSEKNGSGYRPKGRPKEEEMEDDTEGENDDEDKIQVSRSVAQQKLQALMSRRGSDQSTSSQVMQASAQGPAPGLLSATAATAPIPLGHPYNLPAPAPPMTPRTTRRRMLKTELSESMRRQLLWERQVSSNTNPAAAVRRTSQLPLGGLRPLTSTASTSAVDTAAGNKPPSSTKSAEAEDKDERKRRAMARNRSWADDYHYSGW